MAENSSTRIALASFSGTSLQRYASTDVDDILCKVDRNASTFIHVVHTGATVCKKILERLGLPQALAEHIDGGTALELDTSSDRYVFKKFRFVEERVDAGGVPDEATKPGVLIRGSESNRLAEGSGCIVVGDRFVLLFEGARPSRMLAAAVETVFQHERDLRERGIEYLLYRLAKTAFVDNYANLMRHVLNRLQELEAPLLEGSTDAKTYREVARLRLALNPLERSLLHMAEFSATIAVEGPEGRAGLHELAANLGTDAERLEQDFSMLRDRTSELIQTHRDNVDAQLNNIMRSLTVLSAIFMPLSFITSFYGMNFTSIPALNRAGGFPIAVGLMIAIAVGAFTYARRRKWL
jgi:Mg2+ and Co2+ transporter CorA